MTIGIAGAGSVIAEAFLAMPPAGEARYKQRLEELEADFDRYLICNGVLFGRAPIEMALDDAAETFIGNCYLIMRTCDRIFAANDRARICVIGSHSGFVGSYDSAYSAAKAGLHHYVETKELRGQQQLVALAPHIIADAGMTTRRKDLDATLERGARTRIGRWITAEEVAATAYWALYCAPIHLTNTVIKLGGGRV